MPDFWTNIVGRGDFSVSSGCYRSFLPTTTMKMSKQGKRNKKCMFLEKKNTRKFHVGTLVYGERTKENGIKGMVPFQLILQREKA